MKYNYSVINKTTLTYLALFLLGICATLASLEIPKDPYGSLGARVFPAISSGVLLLLGAVGIGHGLRKTAVEEKEESSNTTLGKITALLALSFFYIWCISKLGYLISTALVSPLILMIFGVRNPIVLLIAAIVCPAAYHTIFFVGLGVFPPYGEWFDLLDLIQN